MKDEEYLDEQFPKGETKFRGQAMVLLALARQVGKQTERKRIFELYDKVLEEWFKKWNRKIVTGRCLAELKALKKEVENDKN